VFWTKLGEATSYLTHKGLYVPWLLNNGELAHRTGK